MDRTVTRVVHVKHLAGYILKKWRILLLGMLIGLCVFSVVGVVTIKKSQQQSQTPIEKTKKISVTEAEFANVQGIIDFEILLAEKEAYMENSILMQMDPLSKWTCNDVYTVTFQPQMTQVGDNLDENAEVVIQNTGNVAEKVNALVGLFSEQSFWERLSSKTANQVEVGYLREVVGAGAVSGDKFRVTVNHVNAEKVRELSDLIEECLVEIVSEESDFSNYQISNQKSEPIESVDHGLIENQKNSQIQMMAIREGLASRRTNLEDNTQAYLELYRQAKDLEGYVEGQPLEKVTSVESKAIGFSFKTMKPYMGKGCVVGLLCAVSLLLGVYVFHPCILSPESVREIYDLRVLNDTVYALKREREYQVVASKIDVNIPDERKAEIKVLLTGSVMDIVAESGIEHLKKKMEEVGILVEQSSFLKDKPEEMKKLKGADQVIIVERLEKTKIENLAWQVALFEESNKEIVGIVFV